MNDPTYSWNPLHLVSPTLVTDVKCLEDLHRIQVSENDTPGQNLVLMIGKLIHMTKTLSICVTTDDAATIEYCERLSEDIRRHEKLATSGLIEQAAVMGKNAFRTVVYLPSRMERLSVTIRNILDCCRVKIAAALHFSDMAQKELSEIFGQALDMLKKLGGGLALPNKFLLGQIKFDGQRLERLVEAARCANWERMEARLCPPQRASLYVEILNCFRNVNEGISKMQQSLLAFADSGLQTDIMGKAGRYSGT